MTEHVELWQVLVLLLFYDVGKALYALLLEAWHDR